MITANASKTLVKRDKNVSKTWVKRGGLGVPDCNVYIYMYIIGGCKLSSRILQKTGMTE
jgi:hypothetical protein